MPITRLQDLANKIEFNGPVYRGAEFPEDDPLKINEHSIPDNMRFKWLDCVADYSDDDQMVEDVLLIKAVTQGPFTLDEFNNSFVPEVKRCVDELCKHNNFTQPFNLHIEAKARDGIHYGFGEEDIPFNGYEPKHNNDLRKEVLDRLEDLFKKNNYKILKRSDDQIYDDRTREPIGFLRVQASEEGDNNISEFVVFKDGSIEYDGGALDFRNVDDLKSDFGLTESIEETKEGYVLELHFKGDQKDLTYSIQGSDGIAEELLTESEYEELQKYFSPSLLDFVFPTEDIAKQWKDKFFKLIKNSDTFSDYEDIDRIDIVKI